MTKIRFTQKLNISLNNNISFSINKNKSYLHAMNIASYNLHNYLSRIYEEENFDLTIHQQQLSS